MTDKRIAASTLIKSEVDEYAVSQGNPLGNALNEAIEPFVVRKVVCEWPAVKIAATSTDDLLTYFLELDIGADVALFTGAPELEGRIFYNDDFSGLNCELNQTPLREALNTIFKNAANKHASLNYVGSTPLASRMPEFKTENHIDLSNINAEAYIWIGGPSRISAHYDFFENLAFVVAGRRQFILFPPDQLPNLYIGPLDYSPAGQPISLVDFHRPDFEIFPRFREALNHALVANLEPGDAIFIPSMWWHHVEAFDPVNILVNYWYRKSPAYLGAPMNALEHAMMTLRDLPAEQKEAWRAAFKHYVFENTEDAAAHIPESIRGILNPISQEESRRIRAQLLNRLNA